MAEMIRGEEGRKKLMENIDKREGNSKPIFRIYDMPPSVSNRFIQYAKQYAGNKCWVAIDQLMNQANLSRRLDSFEERLKQIEEKQDGKV